MRRLNHKTGKPFERGELRYDGKKFGGYAKDISKKTGYFLEHWVNPEDSNMSILLKDCRRRAKEKNVPFDLDVEYLRSIKVDVCPVFGTAFEWDRLGEGYDTDNVPSLDKFYAHLGYVKGNVTFLSLKANRIKNDATAEEVFKVAQWLSEEEKKHDAKKIAAAPVPARVDKESQEHTQLGLVFTAGSGEDDYDLNDYSRAVQWQDADNRAQAGSGDSVGCGSQEVGAPQTPTRIENHGQPDAEIVRLEFGRRYLSD